MNLFNKKAVCLLGVSLCLCLTGCGDNHKKTAKNDDIEIKKAKIYVEYGKPISSKPQDYVKNPEQVKVVKEIVPVKEKEPEQPAVEQNTDKTDYDEKAPIKLSEQSKKPVRCGSYDLALKNDKKEKKVRVIVRDTKKPIFEHLPKEVKVAINSTPLAVTNKIHAYDIVGKHKVKAEVVILNPQAINFNVAGTYPDVEIKATDENGNATIKKITVVVVNDNNSYSNNNNNENNNENSSNNSSSIQNALNNNDNNSQNNTNETNNNINNNQNTNIQNNEQ